MRVSRNARRMGDRIDLALDRMGHELIDCILIGQDPAMYGVHYMLITRQKGVPGPNCYASLHVVDWSLHPDPENARWMPHISGAYMLTLPEARASAGMTRDRKLRGTAWVIPGTGKPVPGSGGYA